MVISFPDKIITEVDSEFLVFARFAFDVDDETRVNNRPGDEYVQSTVVRESVCAVVHHAILT